MDLKKRIQDPIGWLVDWVQTYGFENLFKRYYGIYKAIVIDNEDPEKRGRVIVQIPAVGHVTEDDVPRNIYALPCMTGLSVGSTGKTHGTFFPPSVGDQVWVTFENGNPNSPVYMGGWVRNLAPSNAFESTTNDLQGIRTPYGHLIMLSAQTGDLEIVRGDGNGEITDTRIALKNDGSVTVQSGDNLKMELDTSNSTVQLIANDGSKATIGNGHCILENGAGTKVDLDGQNARVECIGTLDLKARKININAPKVNLGQGPVFEPMVKGTALNSFWGSHTHLCTAPGTPSVTPISPTLPTGAVLSLGVKVS